MGKAVKPEKDERRGESGNVLFLILIAVALFAALSYAVTQSSRSGGGDASSETNLISSAQLTQYPASIRTAMVRMIINSTDVTTMRFNRPAEFANLDSNTIGVFHPSGGGAVYNPAPADVMVSGNPGAWNFNAALDIPEIGTSGIGGNDVTAYLIGVKQAICQKINDELSITGIPVLTADQSGSYDDRMYDDGTTDYTFPTTDQPDLAAAALNGQPYGCFQNNGGGDYVYYHVLIER